MASDPDFSLIQAIAQGDKSALETLYERHAAGMLAYLIGQLNNRQLAEDVLQQVMLAVWQSARSFRGESTVQTWMYAITRRRAISARRREPLHTALTDQTGVLHLEPHETIERKTEQTEVRAALDQTEQAIDSFNEILRFNPNFFPAEEAIAAIEAGEMPAFTSPTD